MNERASSTRTWTLLAALIAACGGTQGPPVVHHQAAQTQPLPIRLEVPRGESLAYHCNTWHIDAVGQETPHGNRTLFLEHDRRGQLVLRSGRVNNADVFGGLGANHRDSVRLYFPSGEVRNDALFEQRWVIEQLGLNSQLNHPDLQIAEAMGFGSHETLPDNVVSLSVSRSYRAGGGDESNETIYGHFDVRHGRYLRTQKIIETSVFRVMMPEAFRANMAHRVRTECRLDPELSRERSSRLRDYGVVAPLDRSIDTPWHGDVETEISRLLTDDPLGTGIDFHMKRDGLAVWRVLLADADHHRQCSRMLTYPVPEGLPRLLQAHLGTRTIARCVARAGHPELRPLVARIARMNSEAAELARRTMESAPASLQRLITALEVADVSADALLPIGTEWLDVVDSPSDHVRTIGALVDALQTFTPNESVHSPEPTVRVWLEQLSCRTFGDDRNAWRDHWQTHRTDSYERWLLDAVAEGDAWAKACALGRLHRLAPSDAVHAAAAEHFEHSHSLVRVHGAAILHRSGDRRATAALVEMLDYPTSIRVPAFLGLAPRSAGTLRFDPMGNELERNRGAAHWRAWLAEGGPTR